MAHRETKLKAEQDAKEAVLVPSLRQSLAQARADLETQRAAHTTERAAHASELAERDAELRALRARLGDVEALELALVTTPKPLCIKADLALRTHYCTCCANPTITVPAALSARSLCLLHIAILLLAQDWARKRVTELEEQREVGEAERANLQSEAAGSVVDDLVNRNAGVGALESIQGKLAEEKDARIAAEAKIATIAVSTRVCRLMMVVWV